MVKLRKVKFLFDDAHAVTLPPYGILIKPEYINDLYLIKHELGHWEQYLEWGLVKYYFKIAAQYLVYGRFNAPVEADATERGLTTKLEVDYGT